MSENAIQDQNWVFSKMAVLNTDTVQGTNLVRLVCNENNSNALKVDTMATISFTMVPIDERDENYRTCLTFTGSDGLLYPCVGTADGKLLIDL